MLVEVQNKGMLSGTYDGDTLQVESTIAETTLVDGVSATKTASKSLWTGGTMTYTVVIANETDVDFETPVFTDTLDTHITYVDGSAKVNGTTVSATYAAQLLTINLATIAANSSITLTFDVEQV